MIHPVFSLKESIILPDTTAATLAPSTEMPVHFPWPRKALPGLVVDTHAEFARKIIKKEDNDNDYVQIGLIMHMGNIEGFEVNITLEELSKHMFISGTTGSGKSNFSYVLLDKLIEKI